MKNVFSLIGTTDIEYTGDPSEATCSHDEIDYLCKVVNRHFKKQISQCDIIWSYAGVRPLCEDESSSAQAITRDYTIKLDEVPGAAPLLNIFGGKLTTYRKLGEAAINKLLHHFPTAGKNWTANLILPGADKLFSSSAFATQLSKSYSWLSASQIQRFSRSYGALAESFLKDTGCQADLGQSFGGGLTAKEVNYLIEHEWARTAEDILWRRTKLGLQCSKPEQIALESYVSSRLKSLRINDK